MSRSQFNFIGGSHQERSPNLDDQRTINLYPVVADSQEGKTNTALYGTPGIKTVWNLPNFPIRALYNVNGRAFAVAGTQLFELLNGGGYNALGLLQSSQGFVSIADNGVQLCIVDGPNGYIYNLADSTTVSGDDTVTVTIPAGTYQQIVSEGFYGASTVVFIDGYFIFDKPNTDQFYLSQLYDGTVENALDFASAEGSSDLIVGLAAVRKDLWVFGTQTVQIYYDSGNADFPFSEINGAFMNYGCAAAGSIAQTANNVLWLGSDAQGNGVVWMSEGYQATRVSNYALEYAIQSYGDISKTVSYAYQEEGHYFYCINFVNASTTWVYDIAEKEWHERAYFINGVYSRHRTQNHAFAFGMHIVGDYSTGNIYQQSLNFYDDDGTERRWMRQAKHGSDTLEYLYVNSLQLDIESGIGLETGAVQDVAPQIMLQWSDDGGHKWSNEHYRPAGAIGQYRQRVIWRRLGRTRDRINRVVGVFASKITILQGIIDVEIGSN